MLVAKYTITNSILKNVGVIEASREVVGNTPLMSVWENKFRKEAFEKTVHHSTHLEGNRLSQEEVKELLDGKEVMGSDRDIQEILNYKEALKFVDKVVEIIGPGRPYLLTIDTILEIHRLLMNQTLPPESCGQFRMRQVVVKDTRTGQIIYTPPPAPEVPYLVEDLVAWINDSETRDLHPVLKAGVIHYEIARIHPFVDGNGRVARVLSSLIMFLDGYDLKRFISLDEYFDDNPLDYYLTMQSVSNQRVLDTHERDLTLWLEYFVKGAAQEFQNVKEKVKRISADSKTKDRLGDEVKLTERQMLIIEYLHKNGSLRNRDFRKIFPDHSDDTVLRELKFLKQKNLVKKRGGTKKAEYVLKT